MAEKTMFSMTPRRLWLIGVSIAGLVVTLCVYFATSRERVASPHPSEAPSGKDQGARVRIAPLARPKLVIEEPRPNAPFKVGVPIHVKGYMELPRGQTLFQKEVYLENLMPYGRTTALFSSCLVPLNSSDGRYAFETTIEDEKNLPRKPGTYQLRISTMGILLERQPRAADDDAISNERTVATVPYKIIREDKK